ncbi:FecR family protein [Thalassotalea sp. ND16A]|uniref:FecR family protein n=1 Tax=Thalassotalea sp. ND16A TaxID=1535422 RepID=UPI00136408F5|nr:FecR family protein [Thalassotalea sp. ND16A]
MTKTIKCMVSLIFLLFAQHVYAIDAAGKTMIVRGEVAATNVDEGDKRDLKRRSAIFESDLVTTGVSSKSQFRMRDGGMLALQESTELLIAEYKFDQKTEQQSIVLDLVEGGLRSITGAIKNKKEDYKLKTPTATIGIRGTHYQVQLDNGNLWLAVWDGAIDVQLMVGSNAGTILSLGVGESYSYAMINKNGNVQTFLHPPKIFAQGLSSEISEAETATASNAGRINNGSNSSISDSSSANFNSRQILAAIAAEEEEFIFDDNLNSLEQIESPSIRDLALAKQGSMVYSQAEVFSQLNITDFSASMEINFDNGLISKGQMSFIEGRDPAQWNAMFQGNMNITDTDVLLDLSITRADHAGALADGFISAEFRQLTGLETVFGDFELTDLATGARVNGAYLINGQ